MIRALEIEILFQDEANLTKVLELEEVKESFEKVDYWAGVRRSNLVSNPEEINQALNELSGCYSDIIVVWAIAETEKKNREVRYYETYRMEYEKTPEKDAKGKIKNFTSAIADRKASAHVASYRRIRNILGAYKDACDKQICTLQSMLKDHRKDYNHPQE